jgi:hypothetical protein
MGELAACGGCSWFLVLRSWLSPQAHSPLKLELSTRTAASPERADEGFLMNDEGYCRCAAVLGSASGTPTWSAAGSSFLVDAAGALST